MFVNVAAEIRSIPVRVVSAQTLSLLSNRQQKIACSFQLHDSQFELVLGVKRTSLCYDLDAEENRWLDRFVD